LIPFSLYLEEQKIENMPEHFALEDLTGFEPLSLADATVINSLIYIKP